MYPSLLYMMPQAYVRCYLFVIFFTPKTSLVQVPVCVFLTNCGLVVHSCGIFRAKPVPHLLPSCACAPLHHTLCPHYSRPLLSYLGCLSLHYIIVPDCKCLSLHRTTACYCYLYKTIVAPCTERQQ